MKRLFLTVISIIVVSSCTILPLKKNDYYTRTQMRMIEKTTEALQIGFGYDSRIDINYFFFKRGVSENERNASFGGISPAQETEPEAGADDENGVNTSRVINSYAEALSSYPENEQYDFYLKIYRLYSMIDYMHGFYKRTKNWRLYNIMRLELYPATRYFMNVTEAYFKSKPNLYNRIRRQKETVRKEAVMFVQKKYTIVDEY